MFVWSPKRLSLSDDDISIKCHETTFQCHLADTDAELDGIKDEKYVEVIFSSLRSLNLI